MKTKLSKNHGDSPKMAKQIRQEKKRTKYLLRNFLTIGDNLKLYFNNVNADKWAIIVHGMGSGAYSMTPYIERFNQLGYNTVTLSSKRKMISFANNWEKDILSALDFCTNVLHHKIDVAYGQSFGASAIIDIASKGKYTFEKIIVDSPYASITDSLKNVAPFLNIIVWPIIQFSNVPKNIPQKVSNLTTPLMHMHGEKDELVGNDQFEKLVANTKHGQSINIPNAGHCRGMYYDTENYWNSINDFIHDKK